MADDKASDKEKPVEVDKDGKLKPVDPAILDKVSGGAGGGDYPGPDAVEACNTNCA